MPNYKLNESIYKLLRTRIHTFAAKQERLHAATFPLTTAQVQYLVTPRDIADDLCRMIRERGMRTIQQHREIRIAFMRDTFPALRRSAVVMLALPEGIVVPRATLYQVHTTKYDPDEGGYLLPIVEELDEPQGTALCDWITKAVRLRRMADITRYIADRLLPDDKNGPFRLQTVGHLLHHWPSAATATNDTQTGREWRDKFRNGPKRLKVYHDDAIDEKFGKLIKIADVSIAAGLVIPDHDLDDRSQVNGFIEHWEMLEGDLDLKD